MSDKNKVKFKLANNPSLKEILDGTKQLQESDFTLPLKLGDNDAVILQFDQVEHPDEKVLLESGVFTLIMTQMGARLEKTLPNNVELLEAETTVTFVTDQLDAFFSNLHVYDELGMPYKKRGLLMHSQPGSGKSASLARIARQYADTKNTCVVIYPTSKIEANDVRAFLSNADWSKIDKFIMIMEDLGGGDTLNSQAQSVDAGMLNLLDGVDVVFQKPTFIIATTNHIQNHAEALTNRPGRFDEVYELPPLDPEMILKFYKFFMKEERYAQLTPQDLKELSKISEGFAVAHIKEVYMRSRLIEYKYPDESAASRLFIAANEIKEWFHKHKNDDMVTNKKKKRFTGFEV